MPLLDLIFGAWFYSRGGWPAVLVAVAVWAVLLILGMDEWFRDLGRQFARWTF